MGKGFLILMLSVLSLSCNQIEEEITGTGENVIPNDIALQVREKLNTWNLDNSTSIYLEDSVLFLGIHFNIDQKDSLNSFFLDKESNNIVITLLTESFYSSLIKFNQIKYNLTFESYKDTLSINLRRPDVEFRHKQFEKAPLFYEFAELAIRDMKYEGVLKATQLMRYMESNMNNIFDYKGTFWNILHDYSIACENPSENVYDIYLFVCLVIASSDPNNQQEGDNYHRILAKYIPMGDLEDTLLTMGADELIIYLDGKYGKDNTNTQN